MPPPMKRCHRNEHRCLALTATILTAVLLVAPQLCAQPPIDLTTIDGATTLVRTPSAVAAGGPEPTFLMNGDFDDGLNGWTVEESGGSTTPGSIAEVDTQAQFLEGDSFIVTLRQTILVPGFPSQLTFDLESIPGFDLSASFIRDAFELSLLDDSLLPVVTPWTVGATSCFNLQEDGTANLGPDVTFDGSHVTVDLSALAGGEIVTLYFDLLGGDTDTASGVRIDSVSVDDSPPVGAFVRGDVDQSGDISATDRDAVFDFLFTGGPAPIDCTGGEYFEAADASDNDWVTIADYLAIGRALEFATPLPEPTVICGIDSTDDDAGFGAIDPTTILSAGELTINPPTGAVDLDVFVPVLIDSASDVAAFTVALQYDDSVLTPFDAGLDGAPFLATLGESIVREEPGLILIAVWPAATGGTLLDASPGVSQELGVVRFHLAECGRATVHVARGSRCRGLHVSRNGRRSTTRRSPSTASGTAGRIRPRRRQR